MNRLLKSQVDVSRQYGLCVLNGIKSDLTVIMIDRSDNRVIGCFRQNKQKSVTIASTDLYLK